MAKKSTKKTLKPVRPQLGDGVEILNAGSVLEDPITRTLETNYMPYAMSVIVSRALPEIDGFKPAHRKLLYTMYEMGLLKGARTKSANIVGSTMHLNPHGDAAIYDTMVRMGRSNESLLGSDTVFTLLRSTGLGGNWYELVLAAAETLLCAGLLALFLGTRLGLSIRATGDNPDMVRASSLDPTFTVTVGLCLSNALPALSGAMVGQYQKTVDINSGTGIVVIGLACLIIGETVLGRRTVYKGILAALVGSVVDRFIYAVACYTKVVPVECLKLLTAVIVALAIAAPGLRRWAAFQKQKHSRKEAA